MWKIVHDECVPDQRLNNDPAPCVAVDLSEGVRRGHAILRDVKGRAQFLLVPTARITGIESAALTEDEAPNYFAAAWAARFEVAAALRHRLPREDIGLAVNSALDRSQNQLHIHIDCLRAEVIAALRAHAGSLGGAWSRFPIPLAGHIYMARRLDDAALDQTNPFSLLARAVSGKMGEQTLVVAGMTFPDHERPAGTPGFVLLAGHADRTTGDLAHGEELQDHSCAITQKK